MMLWLALAQDAPPRECQGLYTLTSAAFARAWLRSTHPTDASHPKSPTINEGLEKYPPRLAKVRILSLLYIPR